MADIQLMEMFGWSPRDLAELTPKFRAECLLFVSERAKYRTQLAKERRPPGS